MEQYDRIEDFPPINVPLAMTMGNFDGVHLGHRHLIRQTISCAQSIKGKSAVLTFSNHPSHVLAGKKPVQPLCTPEQKALLLAALSIDFLIQIPFTLSLSKQPAQTFIQTVRRYIPFTHLILGYDARFGKNRQGDQDAITELAGKEKFIVDYVAPLKIDGTIISSSTIRTAVQKGDLVLAEKLLGRPCFFKD